MRETVLSLLQESTEATPAVVEGIEALTPAAVQNDRRNDQDRDDENGPDAAAHVSPLCVRRIGSPAVIRHLEFDRLYNFQDIGGYRGSRTATNSPHEDLKHVLTVTPMRRAGRPDGRPALPIRGGLALANVEGVEHQSLGLAHRRCVAAVTEHAPGCRADALVECPVA